LDRPTTAPSSVTAWSIPQALNTMGQHRVTLPGWHLLVRQQKILQAKKFFDFDHPVFHIPVTVAVRMLD